MWLLKCSTRSWASTSIQSGAPRDRGSRRHHQVNTTRDVHHNLGCGTYTNTKTENKLNALGKPLFKFCELTMSSNKDAVNCEEQARKNKPKLASDAKYQYPADDSCVGRLSLDCIDLKSLSRDITDNIMEQRLKHLQGVIRPQDLNSPIENESFICHTFYWTKTETGDLAAVKHWVDSALEVTERSIDDIKYFFLPVHLQEKSHYSLVIIYMPQGRASATGTIFHMDSLSSGPVHCHDPVKVFETAESFAINVLDMNVDQITKKELQVPQQGPTNNCGFFVLYNIKEVLEEVSDAFPLEQIHSGWYDPNEAAAMRQDTFRLLELNKLKYTKPVPNCRLCGGKEGHISLLKKFENCFSS